jgi:subtilisin family serine protease
MRWKYLVAGVLSSALTIAAGHSVAGASSSEVNGQQAADSSADVGLVASESFGQPFGTDFVGKYLVQLRSDQNQKIGRILAKIGVSVPRSDRASVRGPVFNGFTANLSANEAKKLRKSRRVLSVTKNQEWTIERTGSGSEYRKRQPSGEPDSDLAATATTSLWNLDRINQRNLPLNGDFSPEGTGAGAHIYVLDSGVNLWLADFSGRAGNSGYHPAVADSAYDCDGHGTHVAGTAGGTTYGAAKGAVIHSVRILDCQGSTYASVAIAGLNWIAANLESPAVANASLGGPDNYSVKSAIDSLVSSSDVVVVAAAGNEGSDACYTSPANALEATTVGATNIADQETDFSNFGDCIDVMAPGESITSLGLNGTPTTFDGTSMAAPSVAGIAAIRRGLVPSERASAVKQFVISSGTPNVLQLYTCENASGVEVDCGTPNILAYVGSGNSSSPSPSPTAPAPDPTVPAPAPSASVPGPITRLAVGKVTKKTAVLKWKPPKSDGGSPVVKYQTCISKSKKCKNWKSQSALANNKGLVKKKFKKLKKNVKYIAQIRARNSIGPGAPTKFAFKLKK